MKPRAFIAERPSSEGGDARRRGHPWWAVERRGARLPELRADLNREERLGAKLRLLDVRTDKEPAIRPCDNLGFRRCDGRHLPEEAASGRAKHRISVVRRQRV